MEHGLLNSGCQRSLQPVHHSREFIILFHGILIGIIASVAYREKNYFVIMSTRGDEQCILADGGRVKTLLKSYSCQGNLPIKH